MSKFLAKCSIAFSGTFQGCTHASLGKSLKAKGGSLSSTINKNTTHLVISNEDFEAESPKFDQAQKLDGIQIVSLQWLLDSLDSKSKLDEKSYAMASLSSPPPPMVNGSKGKKRARNGVSKPADDQADEVDQKPKAKKQKSKMSTNGESFKAKQKISTPALVIPVDEGCPLHGSHRVYIDKDEVIYDASLNQTNAGNNNNKFYRIQLLEKGISNDICCWMRWGRVGESGQSKLLGPQDLTSAMREFEKKFREKCGLKWADRLSAPKPGKYTFVELNYEPDNSDDKTLETKAAGSTTESVQEDIPPSQLSEPVQELVQLIFNQNHFNNVMANMSYDANKLPLGRLSKRTLEQGYQVLKDLANLILKFDAVNAARVKEIQDLSNAFYSCIPHDFGRWRPPIINTEELLKKEIALLESLSDMKIAEEIMKEAKNSSKRLNPVDRQYAGLNLTEMTPLDPKSKEFRELECYLKDSKADTHSFDYKVENIFRIQRNGEFDRFESSPFGKLESSDRRLLWHGSRTTNYGGILNQGLRIAPPEAPVSGYMFGKGVYLADMSSKSAGYCHSHYSDKVGLLLLCEVELGNPMLELTNADFNAGEKAEQNGSYSTWGKGLTTPQKWKDASAVHASLEGVSMPDVSIKPNNNNIEGAYLSYNEYIVYDVRQIRLRYLFRVNMGK